MKFSKTTLRLPAAMLNISAQQNEILSACNDLILERLVDYINRSSFFTVLADETTDISCQEQLSLRARFVGDDFSVEEYFLKFVPVTYLSGKELGLFLV